MGSSTARTANWWAVAHTFAILGQLSLCAAGIVTFVFSRPNREDDQVPSDDEFWDDVSRHSTLSSVSGAVGAFTLVVNIIMFIVLLKAYRTSQARRLDSQKHVFKKAVIVTSVIQSLIFLADIAIAVNTGLAGLNIVCGVASIGSMFTLATIVEDNLKLRGLSREQKKHQYVISLTQVSSREDAITAPEAPPSYEAAVRPPKRGNEV
ncbi:hypothetical protein GGR53DRAFT_475949 [Hypoxylon sp. FL1150]|nr:hypothetical protein GGR53DRAFT_475949 [Hypoxylon sp. FL1150]